MHLSLSSGCAHDCVAHRRVAYEGQVLNALKPYGNYLQSETISVYLSFTETLSVLSIHTAVVNELHSKCLVRLEKIMNVFGATSTTDEVLSGVNLQGKRILVTGVSAGIGVETAHGFETQFGTDHLGHFVLVNRIAALMGAGSRLINLSSSGHRYSNVDLDDPNFERTPYEPFVAYGRSKTADILFAVAFY